ncbi:glycosyl hydrolase 115 family protein [Clostridium sp. YIM B02555]|uniref:glycosyl hydrolase 115 family protein n=1 Tax=Clostridium sp. YIM B02555 TaxID=2911968 RepID=UPI001EED184F|nr:glycosyl hydrolase 115 family protein [Clostridium sp. YIM B02555]
MKNVMIAKLGKAAAIYIDPKGKDYKGLKLVANSFVEDINMVTGVTPKVVNVIEELKETIVIAGSIGNNDLIDSLILKGILDVSSIKDKRECYKIQVVEKPIEGIEKAVVIVGSEKRGTIYGIYRVSELIGVSPWVYFGDVVPVKKSELVFSEEDLNITSKEPSVKYRGFFLNDEWPSLGSWVTNTFGDFNEEFYDKVFQLILRLKGNFMWPAMWSAVFSENGKSYPLANAELADTYGIVMGTSHHEPMFRAGEEWKQIHHKYGENEVWDFASNADAITKFWEDGLKRNKKLESLITIGMRGEQDSALKGSEEENIGLLKNIIRTQKRLLIEQGLNNVPKVLTIYKEVEKYWYGTDKAEGLRTWNELDDVTIMLADDNFANVRTLPTEKERNRKAGWGMYYHFDYHGGPRSYEWVNTTPLEKVWEQMSMAYDYGVRDIWIVNIGDLKPMEFPVSYFLDLAYDFETWGINGRNKTKEYTKKWALQQFGNAVKEDLIDGIESVLTHYTKMSGSRKPEVTYASTYSCINYNEAKRVLEKVIDIEGKAQKYYEQIPEVYKDAYYQLVYYPSVASANVIKMQIYAGLNNLYYRRKSILANNYALLVEECKEKDIDMQKYYNESMSAGKWKGMMSSPHIGYKEWSPDGWTYPEIYSVIPEKRSIMIVDIQGTEEAYNEGIAELPVFTNLGKESYFITISNGGSTEFDYKVETSSDFIKVNSMHGSISTGKDIIVSIDWDKVSKSLDGFITISGSGKIVKVKIIVEVIDITDLPNRTFIETHDVVSIEAEHTANNIAKSNVEWKVLENYGRTLSSMKMFPTTVSFEKPEQAPYLEYLLRVNNDEEYTLTTYVAPTNNLYENSRLKYAVAFDDESPIIADTLPKDFITGSYDNDIWCDGVLENIHITTTKHRLSKGMHRLKFYGLDAGVVLQKLVLSKGKLKDSFLGPEESLYYKE